MRFSFKSVLFAAAFLIFTAPQAKADVFVWRDFDTELSLSFPDHWAQIHNQQPDDIFTVAAPDDGQYATCRMRVREDRRFVAYPRRYADEIQRLHVSREFWEQYLGEFAGAELNKYGDNFSLGDGFASFADVSFISASGPKVQKRGLMFASNYNGKLYITECSAEASAYDRWYQQFLSLAKSVDFRDEYHTKHHGWYRNFLKEKPIRIHGRKDVDLYTY